MGYKDRFKGKSTEEVFHEFYCFRELGTAGLFRGEGVHVINGFEIQGATCDSDLFGVVQFADTFVIYTFDQSSDALRALCGYLITFFCYAVSVRWLLRAGVAKGQIAVADGNLVVLGDSIVRAAELESAQGWAGVLFDPKQAEEWKSLPPGWVVKYALPIKDCNGANLEVGRAYDVLNWPTRFRQIPSDIDDVLRPADHAYRRATADFWKSRI